MKKYTYIKPTSVRGYTVNDGLLSITEVPVIDGKPVDYLGVPYQSDGEIIDLKGWPDDKAESFCDGRLLIGLRPE